MKKKRGKNLLAFLLSLVLLFGMFGIAAPQTVAGEKITESSAGAVLTAHEPNVKTGDSDLLVYVILLLLGVLQVIVLSSIKLKEHKRNRRSYRKHRRFHRRHHEKHH